MARAHILIVLAALFFVQALSGQQPSQFHVCVRHLNVPTEYPVLARQARVQGTVIARLKIGGDGSITAVSFTGNELLQQETQKLIHGWTFECQSCPLAAPFEHTLRFNFRLEGEESAHAGPKVTLDLPDEVNIVDRPPTRQGWDEGFSPQAQGQ